MNLTFHRIPRDMFDALGDGRGGPGTIWVLAEGQYSKHRLLLRGVLDAAAAVGHDQLPIARGGFDLLADVERHDPAAAGSVVGYPAVGAWAERTVRALRGEPAMAGAEPGGLAAVAAAAAIQARFRAQIGVPVVQGRVTLPSLGAAAAADERATVHSRPDGADVSSAGLRTRVPANPHRDAPGWLAVRRLSAGSLDVLLDDVDPFRMPAESTVAGRLTSADLRTWTAVLGEAWTLLTRYHPGTAEELAAAIRAMVPLALPPQGQVSTSSAETFGAVALSEPVDARTLSVTLVHEVQHLKLCALLDIVTLVQPDDGRRFYAPWRDDPRPASGLLQGAYAYLGVSRFWHRQRQLDHGDAGLRAHAEFTRWRTAALRVTDTLESAGVLTPLGAHFVQRMGQTLRTWQDEPVPRAAQELADGKSAQHLTRWQAVNGPAPAWPGHVG
jgi:HEXXH motif-containing protein